jgi:DNA-binding HxlR family transcriptional regulator
LDRGQIIAGVGLACAIVFVWIAYELGQIRAGHNSFEAGERYRELERVLDAERGETRELRERIAQLETDGKIDREAYAQVEAALEELESQILMQQEDLEFYRGIVADQQAGLRVQDFVLWPGDGPLSYSMRLVLAQAMRAGSRISGSVELEVEGRQDDEPRTLGLRDVLGGEARKTRLDFSFRYFQNLEAELVLPEGFAPSRVKLRLTPKGKSSESIEKSFDWEVKAG